MNIIVDTEELNPIGTNMQITTGAGFPTEGSVSHSSAQRVLALIAMNYLETTSIQSREDCDMFREYLKEIKLIIIDYSEG